MVLAAAALVLVLLLLLLSHKTKIKIERGGPVSLASFTSATYMTEQPSAQFSSVTESEMSMSPV